MMMESQPAWVKPGKRGRGERGNNSSNGIYGKLRECFMIGNDQVSSEPRVVVGNADY